MSSCGNSNCSCGSNCGCGSNCNCSKIDLGEEKMTTTETMTLGVAPAKEKFEGFEMATGSKNEGCSCNPCKCDPCTCK